MAQTKSHTTVEIAGMQFTGFAGFDIENLPKLDYAGRVKWLRHRIQLVFLIPFHRFVQLEHEGYVWLCVTNLLCSAVEALADFEFVGNGSERFVQFIEKYFSADYRKPELVLHDPRPEWNVAATPAQHLYKYFRCGLAHSFCIEWGGLLHREDGAPSYLFARSPVGDQRSLGVVPRELVTDFLSGVEQFFRAVESREPTTPEAIQFDEHFRDVFLISARTPTP